LGHYRDFSIEFIDEVVNIVDVNLIGFRGNKRDKVDEEANKKGQRGCPQEENTNKIRIEGRISRLPLTVSRF
jgi:hypothetical protein